MQTKKARGKAGSRALRSLPARPGRLLPAPPLLAAFLGRRISFRPAPRKSRPRCRSPPEGAAATPLFSAGARPGLRGDGALQRCPWPRLPGRVRALGSDLFLVQQSEFFSPAGSWLRGEEGAGDSRKTTSRDGLGRGVSPQLRGAPRPPDTPSPAEPGAGGRPARGGCFPSGATTSNARRLRGQGTPVGTFYRRFRKRGLGQGPRTPPRVSLGPGSTAGPTGLSPPLGIRSPKVGGCLKTKITVISEVPGSPLRPRAGCCARTRRSLSARGHGVYSSPSC